MNFVVPLTASVHHADLDPSDAAHSLNLLQDGVRHFLLVRYISIAACAWLFYDHLLTSREEIDLVWKAPGSIAKYAFLLFQYAAPASMTLFVYSTSGDAASLSDTFCRRLLPALAVLSIIFGGAADVLAVLHVSVLWKRNIKVFAALAAAFVITTGAAVIFKIIGLSAVIPTVYHNIPLNVCAAERRPMLLAVPWGVGLIFDAIVMSLILSNAYRRSREQNTHIVCEFHRGGVEYFAIVSAIRIFNLVVTVAAPLWVYGLSATVSWPSFAVSLSRFVYKLRLQQQTHHEIPSDEREAEMEESSTGNPPV